MFTSTIFAAGALISAVAAVPLAKRDIVWVTQTAEDIVTVPVTTTVWVNPGETIPTTGASVSHYGHHHHDSSSAVAPSVQTPSAPATPSVLPSSAPSAPAYSAPSSSEAAPVAPSSSSVYVAPTPSSTSVYVAPTTSTSVWVAPTTSSTSQWVAPSSSAAASPTTYQSSGTGSSSPAETTCTNTNSAQTLSGAAAPGTSYSGDLTWYGTGMGACGCNSGSSDHIVAIAESLFDQFMPSSGNPNMNPLCGKQISITGADGSSYTASIVDRCTGCKEADLDLSETFFNTVTNNGDGRVHNMKWSFL